MEPQDRTDAFDASFTTCGNTANVDGSETDTEPGSEIRMAGVFVTRSQAAVDAPERRVGLQNDFNLQECAKRIAACIQTSPFSSEATTSAGLRDCARRTGLRAPIAEGYFLSNRAQSLEPRMQQPAAMSDV